MRGGSMPVGSSKAMMPELEQIIDALEHPPQRPNPFITISAILPAGYAIAKVIQAGGSAQGISISVFDLLACLFAAGVIASQIIAYARQFMKKEASHDRAIRYAKALYDDCIAQEEAESANTRSAPDAAIYEPTDLRSDEEKSRDLLITWNQARARQGGVNSKI